MSKFFTFLFLLFSIQNFLYAQELKKVSLQLLWKHQFQFAGYYIAKEKGFYEEEGLEVELREFTNGQNITEDVLKDKVTFGVGRSSLLLEKANNKNIVLLASIFQSSPNILLAKKDSHIDTIKDFKNKKIMITDDAKTDAIFIAMLHSNGIDMSDLEIQKHSFNVDDLINDTTQVISSYVSNEPFALNKQGIKYTTFHPRDYGYDFYNDILFTSEKNLYTNYKDVKNFTLATLRGWTYAFEHIEETVELILKKYNPQAKSKEALIFEANELKKLAYFGTEKLGYIDKQRVVKIYDYYRLLGLASKELNVEDFVFNFFESKQYLTNKEKKYLKKKKQISLCVNPNRAPLEALDHNNNHIGITKDFFDTFEKMMGIKFDVKSNHRHKCDVSSLQSQILEHDDTFNYTTPYILSSLVIATRPKTSFINELNDLNNVDIGVLKTCKHVDEFKKKYPRINFVKVDSLQDGLKLVNDGKLFGHIDNLLSISHVLQQDYLGELKIAGKFTHTCKFSIAVPKENEILFNIFQKVINQITNDQKKVIMDKWQSVHYKHSVDYTIIYEILAIFILILSTLIYFYYTLHNVNKKLQISYEKIEQLSITDKLTNLYNRYKIDDVLLNEKKYSDRYATTFGLILLDLDHFKDVNDTYGHNVGDITLQKFAETLNNNTRDVDLVGRWGGEEFIVIVHNVDENQLFKIASNLKNIIENTEFKIINKLTASIGITLYKRYEPTQETISRADNALYNAKQSGRNCVKLL